MLTIRRAGGYFWFVKFSQGGFMAQENVNITLPISFLHNQFTAIAVHYSSANNPATVSVNNVSKSVIHIASGLTGTSHACYIAIGRNT